MTLQRREIIALSCFVLFAMLTGLVWFGYANVFDVQLHDWALGIYPVGFENIWKFVTSFGSGLMIATLLAVSLGILVHLKRWDDFKYLIFVMTAAGATEISMKWLIHRPRPTEIFENTLPNSYSFPSGHTIYGTTFYLAIAFIAAPKKSGNTQRAIWLAAGLAGLLIGASRIFLGVHYFSDVMGGYLVALFWLVQPWSFPKKELSF